MDKDRVWFVLSVGFANQISTCTSIDTDVYMYIGSNVCIYI